MTDAQIYLEIYTRPFAALYQAWGYYYSPLFYIMFLPAVLIPEWMVNLILIVFGFIDLYLVHQWFPGWKGLIFYWIVIVCIIELNIDTILTFVILLAWKKPKVAGWILGICLFKPIVALIIPIFYLYLQLKDRTAFLIQVLFGILLNYGYFAFNIPMLLDFISAIQQNNMTVPFFTIPFLPVPFLFWRICCYPWLWMPLVKLVQIWRHPEKYNRRFGLGRDRFDQYDFHEYCQFQYDFFYHAGHIKLIFFSLFSIAFLIAKTLNIISCYNIFKYHSLLPAKVIFMISTKISHYKQTQMIRHG